MQADALLPDLQPELQSHTVWNRSFVEFDPESRQWRPRGEMADAETIPLEESVSCRAAALTRLNKAYVQADCQSSPIVDAEGYLSGTQPCIPAETHCKGCGGRLHRTVPQPDFIVMTAIGAVRRHRVAKVCDNAGKAVAIHCNDATLPGSCKCP